MNEQSRAAARAVDEARLWRRMMDMARFGATPAGGVNRAAFSPEDIQARKLLIEWAAEFGFSTASDEIGNLYVRRAGTTDEAPAVTGSHLDSQPKGGKFDGAYGVVGGFEALEAIERAGVETRRPIEVVAWSNEEGGRFQPGAMGSAVFAGDFALEDALMAVDTNGVVLRDALRETLDSTPAMARRDMPHAMAGYVEAHIEQGPRLENDNLTIGVVSGVQGLCWYRVEVFGAEAHAGTAPLKGRKDALKSAVTMVAALEQLMADESDTVRFTVGRFECDPGAPSTVPGHVLFTVDFRHPDLATFVDLGGRIKGVCEANARGSEVTVERIIYSEPVVFDAGVIDLVRGAARALDLPHMEMVSGAGHDAMHIAGLCPAGMIFVPCEKGLSHNEAESASAPDLAAGARVLAACLVGLANR
ncbi:MAG: M20 family metallo-hydrolase [Alphaproteobacteria bacterium]|nr:M20 family metallo-hydrolase [Alphaproteobacteria bacterium]MDP6590811.1 M20 family metallo-hydrolase [Alphaproteobacteria bacterium]